MIEEVATPSAEAAQESKPRQPRLTLTVNGETHALLKYPFPVKAATFPVRVNGEGALAACTSGRGKAYTYILFRNTSFYIPGTLPVDAECQVNFPENYRFDESKQVRVSTYKPKKKAKGEHTPADPADPANPAQPAEPGEPGEPAQPATPANPADPANPDRPVVDPQSPTEAHGSVAKRRKHG